ncbi:adenylate kinase family protein [Tautonia rosea]|uniref:adenylate kinase family protein n=1 Tax=Tautonia rosea TaxID=2728037 RepID=UPI001473D9ED|nr:nucleoside monophosphate kinase [Tautonia rosea]
MATDFPLHVVAFGRPGSGKSSVAERLGEAHGFAMVRTGALLRDAVRKGDSLGQQVESLLKAGQLVPDDLAYEVLARDLSTLRHNRLLFDGFPRTLGQVPLLDRLQAAVGFTIDRYVEIAVSADEALRRMSGRRVCPTCGATYHVTNNPPKADGVCDHDGTPLTRRSDDTPEVLRVRQSVYDNRTGPVVDHYRQTFPNRFLLINGEQSFDAVSSDLERALGLAP